MSGLIEELQRNVVNESVSVSTVLRQMKLTAAKLGIETVETWVANELNGYGQKPVPEYRKIRGVLKALNPYIGWINIKVEDSEMLELMSTGSINQPVAELESWIEGENKSGTLSMTLSRSLEDIVQKSINVPFQVALKFDRSIYEAYSRTSAIIV